MNVTLYKVSLKGIWDNKIDDTMRNLLKLNGFILKDDDETFGYGTHEYGYPEGRDYNSWYKNDEYKQFKYQDFPVWVPENRKESSLTLLPEQFAQLMFQNELYEEKIKFDSVSRSTIDIQHPLETMMKELSQVLTNGLSNAIIRQMIKQDKQGE